MLSSTQRFSQSAAFPASRTFAPSKVSRGANGDKKGPPIALIVGIVVGLLVLILLIVLIILFIRKRRDKIAPDYQHEESLSEKEEMQKQDVEDQKNEWEISGDESSEERILSQMVIPDGPMLAVPFIRDYEPAGMMILEEFPNPELGGT
jgi:H+/gluconate symporter-like permease